MKIELKPLTERKLSRGLFSFKIEERNPKHCQRISYKKPKAHENEFQEKQVVGGPKVYFKKFLVTVPCSVGTNETMPRLKTHPFRRLMNH
jgi:hypothetical protein